MQSKQLVSWALVFGLIAVGLLCSEAGAADSDPLHSCSEQRTSVDVTVYNHDLALIQEIRSGALGDIPLIGALFRSTQFRKRQTELVLIVQPRLIKPLGPDPVALPTDFYVEPTDWELYALGRLQSRSSTAGGRDAARGFRENPDQQGGLIGKFGYRVPVPAPRGEGI